MVFVHLLGRNLAKKSLIQNVQVRWASKMARLKVTLCGAAGNVGQPLSLLLKQSPYIDQLALLDEQGTTGLASELEHVDTHCEVLAYEKDAAKEALQGANLVVLVSKAAGQGCCDVSKAFDKGAYSVKETMECVAKHCPKAVIAIATCPVDGMVPLASEILKAEGVYNPKAVLGVTTLNVVRANTFTAETLGIEPECVTVPVVGGNTLKTIVPLLSEAKPVKDFTDEEIESITNAMQSDQSDIFKVKSEGATLATAFSIARFVISVVKGLKGYPDVVECAFVRSFAHPHLKYMALPVQLGPGGLQKDFGMPRLSTYEQCLFERAIPVLQEFDNKAKEFLGVEEPKPCDPCSPSYTMPPCPENWCEKQEEAKQAMK